MEMERINENTIRVLIGNDDLTARGITVLDLLGDHQQIETFFYSILDEVDIDHQFQENDAVTFQVLPNKDGLELFISKNNLAGDSQLDDLADATVDLDHPDEVSDQLKRQLMQTDGVSTPHHLDADTNNVDDYLQDGKTEQKKFILKLGSFENMVQLSRILFLENGASSLYSYQNDYYLELIFFVAVASTDRIRAELAIAYEYADKTNVTEDVLKEHGKKVMADSALELIRHYFND
ncbi:adaptor protein MecA [Levilactobacillus bambusae]|uniref:Adapter protein MecA n=1 Tax=Levilactobacillus bambusae TaxID=2024736 RepID=A0A2V1N1L4_9LACO|nr:adaptor protein MecA [Levilactobacillus bambusae]PWG00618.1 adaptor protein MecA [Levilactobacillus bambusae]